MPPNRFLLPQSERDRLRERKLEGHAGATGPGRKVFRFFGVKFPFRNFPGLCFGERDDQTIAEEDSGSQHSLLGSIPREIPGIPPSSRRRPKRCLQKECWDDLWQNRQAFLEGVREVSFLCSFPALVFCVAFSGEEFLEQSPKRVRMVENETHSIGNLESPH